MKPLTLLKINEARLTKSQLELIAWTLRQQSYHQGFTVPMATVAEFWAKELAPHVHNFNRTKFISAVVNGEY